MPKILHLQALRSFGFPRGRYNTRQLVAGDLFEAEERYGNALIAARKAKKMRPPAPVPPPPPAIAEQIATAGELEALRQQCRNMGIRYDGRWGATRLREAIELGE